MNGSLWCDLKIEELGSCVDRNFFAVFVFSFKFDFAVDQCEDGVVFTHTNTVSEVEFGSTLTDNDVTGTNYFATEFFDTKSSSS